MASDREELRRLIEVIEKAAGSNSLQQAVDDIKTFANTASHLANSLDTRLKRKRCFSPTVSTVVIAAEFHQLFGLCIDKFEESFSEFFGLGFFRQPAEPVRI